MPYSNTNTDVYTNTDMYTNTGMYTNTDMYTNTGMYTNTLSVDDDELLLITCSGESGLVYTVTETISLEGATFEDAFNIFVGWNVAELDSNCPLD